MGFLSQDARKPGRSARRGCNTSAGLACLRIFRREREKEECRAAVGEVYTRLLGSAWSRDTWDARHTQLKNLEMQSSQRNGRVTSMVRNILSAVVRLERRTLELPQFGQCIAT
jgi:hypothetical protein